MSGKEAVTGKCFYTQTGKREAGKSRQTICIHCCLKKRLRDKEKRSREENNPLGGVGREFKPQAGLCLTTIIAVIICLHA